MKESASKRKTTQSQQIHPNPLDETPKFTKEIYDLNIKIDRINDKIKIIDMDKEKLEQLEKEKLAKLQKEKGTVEKTVDKQIKDLNERNQKIFEIQKPKIEKFKKMMAKMVSDFEALQSEAEKMEGELGDTLDRRNLTKAEADKAKLEYDQIKEEQGSLKAKATEILQRMNEMKATFPEDYQYLHEVQQFDRKIENLKQQNIEFNHIIKESNEKIGRDTVNKNEKSSAVNKLNEELRGLQERVEEFKKDKAILYFEENLKAINCDMFLWSYVKEMISQFYDERFYYEDNYKYIDVLRELWTNKINTIFNDEYLSTKRAKESKLDTLKGRLFELEKQEKTGTEEYASIQEQAANLKNELETDEIDFNKVYSLYNDVTLILNQMNKEHKDETFEEHFKNSIRSAIPNYDSMTDENKQNFENVLLMYFDKIVEFAKEKKEIRLKTNEYNEELEMDNKEISELRESIKDCEEKIKESKDGEKANLSEIGTLTKSIDQRTNDMKNILNQQAEKQYQQYLKDNKETLKNFNKIYSKKILEKANKVQKQKIYEDRVAEHLQFKKEFYDNLEFIRHYEIQNKELNEKMVETAHHYKQLQDEVDDIDEGNGKDELKKNLQKRKALKDEMDRLAMENAEKLKIQKEYLEKKYNVEFCIKTLKKLQKDLVNLDKRRAKIMAEFAEYQRQIQEEKLALLELSHKYKMELLRIQKILDGSLEREERERIEAQERERQRMKNEAERLEAERKMQEEIRRKEMRNRLNIEMEENIFEGFNEDFNKELMLPELNRYDYKVKPLIEGCIVYKRFCETNSVRTEYEEYNPNKKKGVLPEAFDYAKRKLFINLRLGRFDFYTAEKSIPRLESQLAFKEIHGIKYSDNAKKIIKKKETDLMTGKCEDYVLKDFIPFTIMTKDNNWDIVCPDYTSYVAVKTIVDSVLEKEDILSNLGDTYLYLLDDPDAEEEQKIEETSSRKEVEMAFS